MLASRLNTGVVTVTLLRLLLVIFSSLLLTANRAQADLADMSLGGGGGCGDPPILGTTFTLDANAATKLDSSGNTVRNPGFGGVCLNESNHSGITFSSLRFTTTVPDHPIMGTIDCFPGTFFTSCGFIVDGGPEVDSAITIDSSISPGTSLTILFFGLDRNSGHNGIPSDSGPLGLGNFEINLNTISCVGGICSQPLDNSHPGGWITGGSPNHFDAQANVPEPGSWILLLSVLGVLAARGLMRRNRRCV